MSTLAQRWMGRGNTVKETYSLNERLAGWVDLTRPILSVMGALGVAAAAALAYGGIPPWQQCLVGLVAALLAYAGIHSFNDYVDSKRDVECWPGRPVPSRRLTSTQVLIFSISVFILSQVLIWVFFNPVCLIISIISIILGCLYSAYLRDRVGYLVLPPIQGILWICGWAAFSPETLFTSWMPWVLYIFSASWQAGHIMIYSPLHPIQKFKNTALTQVPALFKKTSPRTAALLGFIFLVITLGAGIFLGLFADLGLVYLIPVIIMGIITLSVSYPFINDSGNFSRGIRAFTMATYFMLLVRVFILISVSLPWFS
jgi:4-hydroxybenzoate polyprenyltransferase